MGKILLVARPAEAVLILLTITAATTILTLGLVLHGVTSQPCQQTRAATHGPDEVAYLSGLGSPGQRTVTGERLQALVQARVRELIRAPGVTGHSGPYPLVGVLVRADGRTAGAEAEGERSRRPPSTSRR
jgi:putative ABC transport system permease protein